MLKFLIKDYYGIVEDGVLVMVTTNYNDMYYEGTFWYNESTYLLTIEKDLEDLIGNIENDANYNTYISDLKAIIADYKDMMNVLPKLDI